MAMKGDSDRYGALVIALHWTSAAAILALLALGFAAANASNPGQQASLLRLHLPLGVLALALTVVRVGWWIFDKRPDDPAGQPRWQAFTAHAVHTLLYLGIIVMGVSGLALMVLSGAAKILFFGAPGPLPDFAAFKPMGVHGAGAFAIIGLLCIHVGAALYHQIVRRDRLLARIGLGSLERGLR